MSHNGDDRGNHNQLFLLALLFFGYLRRRGALAQALNSGRDGGCCLARLKSQVLRYQGRFFIFNDLVDVGKDAMFFY
jgi:hypothetical protein